MASDTIVVAALGRPFTLGMLYDARKDELIPGLTFWDDKTLQQNTVENEHRVSDFHITTSDCIEAKCSLLDADTSLKASFMCGHMEVTGSAKYLSDKKRWHNQSRVTFQYKATTSFKQLLMTPPEAKKMEQTHAVKGLATHVVTGILYGANAFFVFDSEKVDASSVQDIQGQMEAVIKKMPSFNVDIKLTDEEEALTDKLSCKFYGDFILESNPTTFEDAVKTYQRLPKVLEKRYWRGGVPLKVWMMPLKNQDPQAAEAKTGISVGLVMKAEDALEDVWQLEIRCNDCLEETAAKTFPQIHEKLSRFKKLCNYYREAIQQQMAKQLPLIREGAAEESDLRNLFEYRDMSPFSHGKLSQWIDNVEREIMVIRSCVEMMKGIKIIPSQSELDREILAPGVRDVFCFVFTSLKTADPYLQEMADYVDLLHVNSAVHVVPPSRDQWYFSDEVITKMREKVNAFNDLIWGAQKSSKVFVTAIANIKYRGATIFHYRNGILVSDSYSKPQIPVVKKNNDYL